MDIYKLGEIITFKVTVTNEGNVPVSEIYVNTKDPNTETIDSLIRYEYKTFTVNHTVTEEDIINGYVRKQNENSNSLYTETGNISQCTIDNGTVIDSINELKEFCIDGSYSAYIENPNIDTTIAITNIAGPLNGITYVVGEVVTFNHSVSSSSNITLSDVNVVCGNANNTFATLKPGKSQDLGQGTYTITQADKNNGYFTITARLTATTAWPGHTSYSKIFTTQVEIPIVQEYKYTVDTRKVNSSNTKTSIPFDLYNVNNSFISIDWGDNTANTYTKTNYSSSTALNKTASTGLIHTYSTAGAYTITVYSSNFNKVKIYSNIDAIENSPIYYYRKTLTKVNTVFPELDNNNTFEYCFFDCESLRTIPAGLFRNNTNVISFESCFKNCTSLQAIPTGLFADCNNAINFESCFENCSTIVEIPTGLFDSCVNVTSPKKYITDTSFVFVYDKEGFSNCFNGCTALTTIPESLFDENVNAKSFYYTFANCSSITTIPENLFKNNTIANSFEGTFYGCSSLASIKQYLFKYNKLATTFNSCFRECTTITSIPGNLFENNPSVNSFHSTFMNCTSLVSIPVTLFKDNTKVKYFYQTFRGCSTITEIPAGLFDYNTVDTNPNDSNFLTFQYCFANCTNLVTVPSRLFVNNTNADNFAYVFYYCLKLKTVPANIFGTNNNARTFEGLFSECALFDTIPIGIFYGCKNAKNMSLIFYKCPEITEIPENLFKFNINAEQFRSTFAYCSGITNIPINLFIKNTKVLTFKQVFASCINLEKIPVNTSITTNTNVNRTRNLFDKCINVKSFMGVFQDCSLIPSIPPDLFKYNTAVENFSGSFNYCIALTSIPAGLFDNCPGVKYFGRALEEIKSTVDNTSTWEWRGNGCFESCTKITAIPENLFASNSIVENFDYCFKNCSLLTNFTINITSPSVGMADDFVTYKEEVTRTVKVPANSTTKTTFNRISSSLGLSIETL